MYVPTAVASALATSEDKSVIGIVTLDRWGAEKELQIVSRKIIRLLIFFYFNHIVATLEASSTASFPRPIRVLKKW